MARVLVTEEIADRGLEQLRDAGHEVDVRLGLDPEQLLAAMPGAAALIVRSATDVTADVIAAGTDLVIVGRAGIGLDNVDVAETCHRRIARWSKAGGNALVGTASNLIKRRWASSVWAESVPWSERGRPRLV